MFETGLKLLFSTFVQLIFVILYYEYIVIYKLKSLGQANLEPLKNVNSLIWFIILIELIISSALIKDGWKGRKK